MKQVIHISLLMPPTFLPSCGWPESHLNAVRPVMLVWAAPIRPWAPVFEINPPDLKSIVARVREIRR